MQARARFSCFFSKVRKKMSRFPNVTFWGMSHAKWTFFKKNLKKRVEPALLLQASFWGMSQLKWTFLPSKNFQKDWRILTFWACRGYLGGLWGRLGDPYSRALFQEPPFWHFGAILEAPARSNVRLMQAPCKFRKNGTKKTVFFSLRAYRKNRALV